MPEFLAETYTPRDGPGGATVPRAGDLARAAAQASRPGAAVRFLGAIAVPAEETCFYLYQAPAAEAVRAAMTAAGLRPERITPAETLRPRRPARPGGGARSQPATPLSNALTEETPCSPTPRLLPAAQPSPAPPRSTEAGPP